MMSDIPDEIMVAALEAEQSILPEKSRDKYREVYNKFIDWRTAKNVNSFDENVFLAYFSEMSKKYLPSTVWSQYSMLKSTMNLSHNLNIGTYTKLGAFLKRNSSGFKSKQSKVFEPDHVKTFLQNAPDVTFLDVKIVLIFGVSGACRTDELVKIKVEDISDQGDLLLVNIPETKTNVARSFTIGAEFARIVRQYSALRPKNVSTNRYFLNYQQGKCTVQVIGKHKFTGMPKRIAQFLHLPDAHLYTGHSFRRTSATLLANSGANITALKRHGGWKSTAVAEHYIEDSISRKRKTGNTIMASVLQTASENDENMHQKKPKQEIKIINSMTATASTTEKSATTVRPTAPEDCNEIGTVEELPSKKLLSVTLNNCSNLHFSFKD